MNKATIAQGFVPPFATDDERRQAVDLAFDYRGDVTIETNTGETLVGYVSNRDTDSQSPEPFLDLLPATATKSTRVKLSDIRAIQFTGIDTAAGKSWENWLKKVAEAEAQGSIAELYPEEE